MNEDQFRYRVFLFGGGFFDVLSPDSFPAFVAGIRSFGAVTTNTGYTPIHAILTITWVQDQDGVGIMPPHGGTQTVN